MPQTLIARFTGAPWSDPHYLTPAIFHDGLRYRNCDPGTTTGGRFGYSGAHLALLPGRMPPHLSSSKGHGLAYRPGIDGMRAIAVLGVVLYHAGFGPPGGFVGVDVFFVISGFLITSLLEIELARDGRISLAAFYARRVRRLLPALAVVLVATVAGCFAILSPYGELSAALRSVAASSVFGANIFFQYSTGSYFGPNVNHLPLLHLWSLGVEEQYYLLWPVALLLARKLPLSTRRIIFAACAAGSLAYAEWALYGGSQAAFYAMPARWWELSLGALVAWAPPLGERRGRWESVVGVLLIFAAMAFPTQHFPGIGALPATVGAAMLIHASAVEGGAWRILSSAPMRLVGHVSYPFYLWHWPLLALTAVALPGELPVVVRAALVVSSFLLALGTWRYVEKPLRHVRLTRPRRLVGVTLVACLALSALSVGVADAVKVTPSARDLAAQAARDVPPNMTRCHANALAPVALPDESECTLGGRGKPRIVIWGDSHALALQPFAAAVANQAGEVAIAYSRDACAPALNYDNGKFSGVAAQCKAFNTVALEGAETMDTVILASRWPRPEERHFAEGVTATIRALAPHVRRILIIGPTPVLPSSVPECMARHALHACDLPRTTFTARSESTRALLSAFPSQFANVSYVDPTDFFCSAETCPAIRDGIPLYWDDNHISSRAAAAFGRWYMNQGTKDRQ